MCDPRSKYLVVGDAYVDFVLGGVNHLPEEGHEVNASRAEMRAGGSAGYAASALESLGAEVTICAPIGTDYLGEFWRNKIGSRVNSFLPIRNKDERTGAGVVILTPSERTFVTHQGANANASSPTLDPDIEKLFITAFSQAPYLWNEMFVERVADISGAGTTVSLDTNWAPGDWKPYFWNLLSSVDILFTNEIEATSLAMTNDVVRAAETLVAEGAGMCLVTLGERGCAYATQTKSGTVDVESVEAIDTNAAGDFFAASFLYDNSEEIEQRCRRANSKAARSVTEFELEKKLKSLVNA